jgi:hypothetical protein
VGFNIGRELVFDTQTAFLSQPQKIFEEPLETNRISGSFFFMWSAPFSSNKLGQVNLSPGQTDLWDQEI